MSHPLDGADLRILRANHHLHELQGAAIPFLEGYLKAIRVYADPIPVEDGGKRGQVYWADMPTMPVPIHFSVYVGEIIYNLRATLDYLVYELARKDFGSVQHGTQFPIFSQKKVFDAKVSQYLKGVSVAHRAAIEKLQPYRGGNWLATLADISNPDKHRELITTTTQTTVTPEGPTEWAVPGIGAGVQVKLHLTPFVAFTDGAPIIETLDGIKARVTDTIDGFKPEF